MPIALTPDTVVKIQLDSDKDNPDKPTFLFRHLVARKQKQVVDLFDSIGDDDDADVTYKTMQDVFSHVLCGWNGIVNRSGSDVTIGSTVVKDGQPVPFDVNGVFDIVSLSESMELMEKYWRGVSLDKDDQKN